MREGGWGGGRLARLRPRSRRPTTPRAPRATAIRVPPSQGVGAPPVTESVFPVVYDDSSEARYTYAPAISTG